MKSESELESWVEEKLGVAASIALSLEPIPPESLSPDEKQALQAQEHPNRRLDWLRGRGALKALLRKSGNSEDTARLSFPHPRLSLSHSGGLAVAASVSGTEKRIAGLGVDFEAHRPLDPGSARFFLDDGEREKLWAAGDPSQGLLLRLWTVKEAVYKADPGNRGRTLVDYRLRDPGAMEGEARGPEESGSFVFRYCSLEMEVGFVSMALRWNLNGTGGIGTREHFHTGGVA